MIQIHRNKFFILKLKHIIKRIILIYFGVTKRTKRTKRTYFSGTPSVPTFRGHQAYQAYHLLGDTKRTKRTKRTYFSGTPSVPSFGLYQAYHAQQAWLTPSVQAYIVFGGPEAYQAYLVFDYYIFTKRPSVTKRNQSL